jgi:hypothetical protein
MTEKLSSHPNGSRRVIVVILAALAYGLITRLIFGANITNSFLTTMSLGFLCGVPAAISVLSVVITSRQEAMTGGRAITLACITASIFLVSVVLVNLELAICIVMAAPLFLAVAALGGFVTHRILQARSMNQHISASLFLLILAAPYLVTPLEKHTAPLDLMRTVETQLAINAAPDVVCNQIIRVPRIAEAEQRPSLFQLLGIPRPLQATLEGEGVGAMRHGIFEYGIRFNERITTWKPSEAIAFDINMDYSRAMPAPLNQIGGPYFEVLAASYRIEPLNSQGVMLHLTSTYRLSTDFNFYGSIWTDLMMTDFQNYVLNVVKRRAERV